MHVFIYVCVYSFIYLFVDFCICRVETSMCDFQPAMFDSREKSMKSILRKKNY